jgi:hypothetical protein
MMQIFKIIAGRRRVKKYVDKKDAEIPKSA